MQCWSDTIQQCVDPNCCNLHLSVWRQCQYRHMRMDLFPGQHHLKLLACVHLSSQRPASLALVLHWGWLGSELWTLHVIYRVALKATRLTTLFLPEPRQRSTGKVTAGGELGRIKVGECKDIALKLRAYIARDSSISAGISASVSTILIIFLSLQGSTLTLWCLHNPCLFFINHALSFPLVHLQI